MSGGAVTPERRVTLGLVLAICVQMAAAFIWAGQMGARTSALERAIPTYQADHVSIARMETRVESISQQLDRIEARLEAQP